MLLLVTECNQIISDQFLDSLYKDLINKMVSSGIWEGKPFSDSSLAKKFKKEFEQFASDKSFMVKDDKVAVA